MYAQTFLHCTRGLSLDLKDRRDLVSVVIHGGSIGKLAGFVFIFLLFIVGPFTIAVSGAIGIRMISQEARKRQRSPVDGSLVPQIIDAGTFRFMKLDGQTK